MLEKRRDRQHKDRYSGCIQRANETEILKNLIRCDWQIIADYLSQILKKNIKLLFLQCRQKECSNSKS